MLFFIIMLTFILIFLIVIFGDYNTKETQRDYVKFNNITSSK